MSHGYACLVARAGWPRFDVDSVYNVDQLQLVEYERTNYINFGRVAFINCQLNSIRK